MNKFLLKPLALFLAKRPRVLWGLVLIYILMPLDILPEAVLGPLGLLDDLVILIVPMLLRKKHVPPGTKRVIDTTAEVRRGPREPR